MLARVTIDLASSNSKPLMTQHQHTKHQQKQKQKASPSLSFLLLLLLQWRYIILISTALIYLVYTLAIFANRQTFANTSKTSMSLPEVKGEKVYIHDNKKLVDVAKCTNDQLQSISSQLELDRNVAIAIETKCPNPTWITNFYKEEKDIGSSSFLGVNIGCNKGQDAIRSARMGMSNAEFDVKEWNNAVGIGGFRCGSGYDDQPEIVFPSRLGEMHCIEPITGTFERLAKASSELGYDEKKGFVLTQAVVSSRNGEMEFSGNDGQENLGIHDQRPCQNPSDCKKVPMYSADSYFDKFVQSKGPVNILLIDVEGWDFDVLFGASSVLERTQYLEFEYHSTGPWGRYHLPDTVRLLDHKGFTCYWAGKSKLWRITGCHFDVYNTYHDHSNVACVHRTYEKLAERMESLFLATI